MPGCEAIEIPIREAYLGVCRHDGGREQRSRRVFFSSLSDVSLDC